MRKNGHGRVPACWPGSPNHSQSTQNVCHLILASEFQNPHGHDEDYRSVAPESTPRRRTTRFSVFSPAPYRLPTQLEVLESSCKLAHTSLMSTERLASCIVAESPRCSMYAAESLTPRLMQRTWIGRFGSERQFYRLKSSNPVAAAQPILVTQRDR